MARCVGKGEVLEIAWDEHTRITIDCAKLAEAVNDARGRKRRISNRLYGAVRIFDDRRVRTIPLPRQAMQALPPSPRNRRQSEGSTRLRLVQA